jgi:quinoprotein glucose dehydrogenase
MKHIVNTLFIGVLVSTVLLAQTTTTRNAAAAWPVYNRDLAGTRYSPLAQINTTNVARLTQAWSYRLRPQCKGSNAINRT